jgi:peptide/nickel transport system substrate-binding protein
MDYRGNFALCRLICLVWPMLVVVSCVRAPLQDEFTLIVAQSAEPKSLDPHVATSLNDFRILENVFEGLVRFKPLSLEIESALAVSWEVTPDGLAYTFQLRPGVFFHDGSPLNAEAVKFSFERMLIPTHPAHDTGPFPLAFFFSQIDAIEVIDTLSVRFHLKEPYAPFLPNLAYPTGFIVSQAALEGNKRHEFGRHPSGTGPFRVGDWHANRFVRLEGNPLWRGKPPALKAIFFRPFTDENARVASLLSGESHIVVEMPADLITHFRKNPEFNVLEASGPHVWFLIFNTRVGPLRDSRVRQAVNLAIDKRALVEDLLQGSATIAKGPIPEAFGMSCDPTIDGWPYDPEKARQLVREAGAVGLVLTLLTTEGGSGMLDPKSMATAIQSDLAKVGLVAEIETYEWNTFLKKVNSGLEGNADMAQMAWMTNDPDTLLFLAFRSEAMPENGGFNSGYYSNSEVDLLIEEARREIDPSRRQGLYHRIQRIIHEDAPCAFIASWRQNAVTTRSVQGLQLEPSFLLRLGDVSLNFSMEAED